MQAESGSQLKPPLKQTRNGGKDCKGVNKFALQALKADVDLTPFEAKFEELGCPVTQVLRDCLRIKLDTKLSNQQQTKS